MNRFVRVVVASGFFAGLILVANVVEAWGSDPTATLSFVILKDESGKPVRNAAVVLHPVNTKGKQGRGGFELKTDNDGKTHFEGVPYGKLRVQVLAPGFQTFGEDYEIGEPEKEIIVRMKRPQKQYSIYDEHPEQKKDAPSPQKDSTPPQ
jgi:hypothetical protein